MPIAINGSGSITGISAGGLPDGVITTDDLAANAVTTAKLGSGEASGLCKAWVNFNGTGTVAIRASYNVSSITDDGVGVYRINFTTAMSDVNYVTLVMGIEGAANGVCSMIGNGQTYATSSVPLAFNSATGSKYDPSIVCVAVFR